MLVRRGAFANSAGAQSRCADQSHGHFHPCVPKAGTGRARGLFKHVACDFSPHVGEGDGRQHQVPAQIERASGAEGGGVDVRMNVGDGTVGSKTTPRSTGRCPPEGSWCRLGRRNRRAARGPGPRRASHRSIASSRMTGGLVNMLSSVTQSNR